MSATDLPTDAIEEYLAIDVRSENESIQLKHYQLLASSIAGRRVAVCSSSTGLAYCDGPVIYVCERDTERLVTGLVAQAALLAAGSLRHTPIHRLRGRGRALRRYLTLELARAAADTVSYIPSRYQAMLASAWDGRMSASSEDSVERALSREPIPEASEIFGTIRWRVLLKADPDDVAPAPGAESRKLKDEAFRRGAFDDSDDDDAEPSEFLKLMAALSAFNPLAQMFAHLFGMRKPSGSRGSKSEGGGGEMGIGGRQKAHSSGSHAQAMPGRIESAIAANANAQSSGSLYPEWDWREGCYRPNWCRVLEFDPEPVEHPEPLRELRDVELLEKLARLGTTLERHRLQPDGCDLDVGGVIAYAVDAASGYPGDERIYEARLKTRRDLAVMLLLDASGSVTDGQIDGKSIWSAQCVLVQNTATALERLGDRVAAYAFQSSGRDHVWFLRIKDFDERFGVHARARLGSVRPRGYTRLGAGIRHAVETLAKNGGVSNKVLLVVSDGIPFDYEYEGEYAERDVRQALIDAEARGIGCVCVALGSSVDSTALARLWGAVGYAQLAHPSEFGIHLQDLFDAAISRARRSDRPAGKYRGSPTN